MTQPSGTLYLVSTPIGNVGDLTLRAKEILGSVDVVACEDTRRTGLFLKRVGVSNRLESFHDHSGTGKTKKLIDFLLSGKNVALVSDAGTPLVTDPGFPLVREGIENQIRVEGIPGPCAAINALIVSGFACEQFVFYGFLPQKEKRRRDLLREAVREEKTLIFYESPHRLIKALKDVAGIFGSRRLAVAREMTKKFEEVVRGSAAEVTKHFENKQVLGEIVIVMEGAQ